VANKASAPYIDITISPYLALQIFLIYDNYNNHIINNKSDKNKILNLRISARHWQWRRANTPQSVAFLLK
jgi:hypothetical protein